MKNTLILEKRGGDFWKGDEINNYSDIKNYRIGVYEYIIEGKDNRKYIIEFTQATHYNYRRTHKTTGKPLKNPIKEIIVKYGLFINTQYETTNGTYRNSKIENEIYNMHLPYTKEGILTAVNYISKDKYTDIIIKE